MRNCLGVACLLVAVVAGFAPASSSPAGRELTSAEAWSTYGGFKRKCVAIKPLCVDTEANCDQLSVSTCDGSVQYDVSATGNNKYCDYGDVPPGNPCTQTGQNLPCLSGRLCHWSSTLNSCTVDVTSYTVAYAYETVTGWNCD